MANPTFNFHLSTNKILSKKNNPQIPKNPSPLEYSRKPPKLANLLQLQIESAIHKRLLHNNPIMTTTTTTTNNNNLVSFFEEKQNSPILSPKENISKKWREIHGFNNNEWEDNGFLDPLHPWLRREIIKYGEFAQATYDAFDFDSFSEYCGSCRYNCNKILGMLGLGNSGYKVTNYIYAMSQMELPRWIERSMHLVDHDTWSKDSNWMGFVAVSDNDESTRIGRRDIVVAWRGTVSAFEWYEDFQRKLKPIGGEGRDSKVEHGFLSIYTSKSDSTRYNKSSASEQVMKEVKRLVHFYKEKLGEEVSLTITGHSLGGALALLNAYEVAQNFQGLPISVISFGAPRVGNNAFKEELFLLEVKVLRVTVKQDLVPRMPGIVFNESTLKRFDDITAGTLEWVYTHVGAELKLDIRSSPYLKRGFNLLGFHMLETYLHLVDGFLSTKSTFRLDAKRDVALVNKTCDMLIDELKIPHFWYQQANKGLVCNAYGRWVRPKRDQQDIPSPTMELHSQEFDVQED